MFISSYLTFFATLAVITYLVTKYPFTSDKLATKISGLAVYTFNSSPNETPKFVLIRIGFGIVIAIRGFYILYFLSPSDFMDLNLMLVASLNMISGILLILGLFSQYTLLYLVLFQWQIGDQVLNTDTLGNDVGAMLAILLWASNCGKYVSIDGLLISRSRIQSFDKFLLYYQGPPSYETLSVAKLLAIFSYWLVCLYSLSMHINEPAWMSGNAGPWLLANNFMSIYSKELVTLFSAAEINVIFAKISLWMMLPWYLLILPFTIIGGWFREYIIIWGILFFILSTFILQLGWLGEIEFLLWAAIFWANKGIINPQSLEVAFDDKCNLCDKTIKFIRAIDIFEQVKLRPVSLNGKWLNERNIPEDKALIDLYGYDSGKNEISSGYNFYITLARKLVLLWWVYPILIAGKWVKIGPIIYRWIALRRRKIFGICNIPSKKREINILKPNINNEFQKKVVNILALNIIALGVFYLIAMPAPYIGYKGFQTPFSKAAHMYGITPINVFNETDLKSVENWFTIHVANNKGVEKLVPLLNIDGSRLEYHSSDRVYFGSTISFRRKSINTKKCLFDEVEDQVKNIATIYLRINSVEESNVIFKYTQYFKPIADVSLLDNNIFYENVDTEIRCQKEFIVQ